MKTRVICLPPGQLQPGSILAVPITGANGKVLLAAGVTLDEGTLDNLRQRMVPFVSIAVPDSRDEATIERELAEAAARVDYIFRGKGSAAREELRPLIAAYRQKQLS